jgi:hypothetical protein
MAAILNGEQVIGHNFEIGQPKDNLSQIWFNSDQQFQRRRFECESVRTIYDRRQVMAKAYIAFGQVS